jgi:hypothetical protein
MTPPCPAHLPMKREARVFGTGPPAVLAQTADGAVARFDVSATLRGQSAFFKVYYDDALGADTGGALADGVLAQCDADYEAIYEIFGSVTPPLPMTCIVSTFGDAMGGGYHYSCLDNVLYVTGQALAPPNTPDVATALAVLVAEEVEVFSAAQGLGWNCGDTNGEGLSRVLAEELYPGVLDYFHKADKWLDSSRPNYVSNGVGNDSDPVSNGCSVVFLYYLRYILGYEWVTIVQAGGSTLEQTYQNLTGNTGGYSALRQCVDPLFPPGSPSGLTTDNPFPVFDYYAASVSLMDRSFREVPPGA